MLSSRNATSKAAAGFIACNSFRQVSALLPAFESRFSAPLPGKNENGSVSAETSHGVCRPVVAPCTESRTDLSMVSIASPGSRADFSNAAANGELLPVPSSAVVPGEVE